MLRLLHLLLNANTNYTCCISGIYNVSFSVCCTCHAVPTNALAQQEPILFFEIIHQKHTIIK